MSASLQKKASGNLFLRMLPLQRMAFCFFLVIFAYLIIRSHNLGLPLVITICWDVFAFFFITISWIVFFTRPVEEIMKQANKDDGSRVFVLVSILTTSFASVFAVIFLMITKDQSRHIEMIALPAAVFGIIFSWIMVHTLFAFHYAHLYYGIYEEGKKNNTALIFPDEKKPDYLDFAYFSFIIGMTFQVSDVEISSAKIRRTALVHSLLSFGLNTIVVALTINLILDLRNKWSMADKLHG